MKSVAVISSGFLRNYRFFLESNLHERMLKEFDCDFYIATWEESGYGTSYTPDYSSDIIEEKHIRSDFGERLKYLHREPFSLAKNRFKYDPVMNLMRAEPQVIEKYRSKFYMLNKICVPEGYDAYFHIRFDIDPYKEMGEAILSCLSSFSSSENAVYTARDMFDRKGCFGDIFQISDHDTFVFFQGLNKRLYDESYLSLDIPRIPERIPQHYFDTEMPYKKIKQIQPKIKLNRKKYSFFEDESSLFYVFENNFNDEFNISKCKNSIIVRRKDCDSGWGQNLCIKVKDKENGKTRMLHIGPSKSNEKTVGLAQWDYRKAPKSSPKILMVLAGEAFRHGGQRSRKRDTEESFEPQRKASLSHMGLVGKLEGLGLGCDILINSYKTRNEKYLLDWYGANLLACSFKEENYGLENFMRDSMWESEIGEYESVFLCRLDLEFKDYFLGLFDPEWDRIMFPSMCSFGGSHLNWGQGFWTPRISDTMMFVPGNMAERVRSSFHLNHSAWAQYNKDGIANERMGLMLKTFHDSDSAKDYNPLYRIAGRGESKRWYGSNMEAGENYRPEIVMKNIEFPDWKQPSTENYEDEDMIVSLKYDEYLQKETFQIRVDKEKRTLTLKRTDEKEGWNRKVRVFVLDKSNGKKCEILVGNSELSEKSTALYLSPETYEDENIKAELIKNGRFPDAFRLTMHSPREFLITRLDEESGWGQDLSIVMEYKRSNKKIQIKVGSSRSQTKTVKVNDPILLM